MAMAMFLIMNNSIGHENKEQIPAIIQVAIGI